jgi:hypothetical protein
MRVAGAASKPNKGGARRAFLPTGTGPIAAIHWLQNAKESVLEKARGGKKEA